MEAYLKYFYLSLYYLIGYNMPNYSFPGGKIFNKIRIILLKNVIPVGENCRIMRHVYIGNGENIKIGRGCRINEGVRLDNVTIGDNVMIARESVILGKMHGYSTTDIPMVNQIGDRDLKTVIEDDVWLGLRVVIMPGVCIKKGCIIGAGAVLTKSTLEYCIYGGIPARMIKSRS